MAAGQMLLDEYREAEHMTRIGDQVELSTRIGALVHELQCERDTSALFLGPDGGRMQRALADQRTYQRDDRGG